MGAIGIVALVIVVLIVSAIGFQNLLAAIGVAIFFALFLRYITDEYYKFSEGLSGAIVSLGIAGILSIFIDIPFYFGIPSPKLNLNPHFFPIETCIAVMIRHKVRIILQKILQVL